MSIRSSLAKMAVSAIGQDVFGSILAHSGMSSPARIGTRQLLKGYTTMPWLRAVVQKVSWSVATNQWQLFVAQREGKAIREDILAKSHDTRKRQALIKRGLKAGELREITNNAYFDFVQAGTPPFFDGLIATQLTQQHQDLVGESLWVMERGSIGGKAGRGVPLMYWVIPPSWIQSVPSIGHPFFKIVGPYGSRDVPIEDAVWSYQPHPGDPYNRGAGVGAVLGDELETDEYAAKYTKAFFYNDARPPFMVSIDGADEKEVRRVDTWWSTKHQGFGRWWKPGFIGKKIDIHEFGQTMQNMQMVPLREFERNTILQVYGFPPEIFGIVESSNRATAEAAKSIYAEHVVEPRLEFERARRQRIAVQEFDERLIVEFVSPVPEDKEHQLKVMTAVPYAFEMAEVRTAAGIAEKEDGSDKVHMVPFTVVPRKRLDETDEPVAPEPVEELNARLYRKGSKTLDEKDIPKILARVKATELSNKAKPVIRDAVKFFGQQSIDDVGGTIDFNLRSRRVEDFIASWAGDRIKEKVNDTTLASLRDTLLEGTRAGEPTSKLADRIKDVFDIASDSRANAIARTEIGRASNFGALEGMEQAGIEEKEWLATQDDATRDSHADMDGQRVEIDEEFESSSGATAMYPGDFGDASEDVNCRCVVLSVIGKTARSQRWKAVEAERAPYDRRLRRALKQGFANQEAAVLDALASLAEDAAA